MKLSIAQLVSGELIKQLNQAVEVAYSDESDLVVFPAFVFETPLHPQLPYNTLDIALYSIARLLHKYADKPIHMIFPFMNHREHTLLIHAYRDTIEIFSFDVIEDLQIDHVRSDVMDDFNIQLDTSAHLCTHSEGMLEIEGKRVGVIFDFNSHLLDEWDSDDYPYDIMLYFSTTPLIYREGERDFRDGTPYLLGDLNDRHYAKDCICVIENCGLYNEYVSIGGSYIVDTVPTLLGKCPMFNAGVLSAEIEAVERGWDAKVCTDYGLDYKPLDISSVSVEKQTENTLNAIKLAMRNYASRMGVDTIVVPLLDTFSSMFLYDLVCDVFNDREIVAVAHEEYPSVLLQYDLDKAQALVYAQAPKLPGHDAIEGIYAECQRIARYSNGLAIIPECMSDYIQDHIAPLSAHYVFSPFSHLLYTDLFRIKDFYEQEKGIAEESDSKFSSLESGVKSELRHVARQAANAYLSCEYDKACDVASAMGRLWDRSDYDCQEVLRNISCDPERMRYLVRYFYQIMDELLYGRFLQEEWEHPFESNVYDLLSDSAKEQLQSYRVRGLSSTESVAQGIVFRYPLREPRAIPSAVASDMPPVVKNDEEIVIDTVDGINFNYEKPEVSDDPLRNLTINKVIDLRANDMDGSSPLDMIDAGIKEQLFRAIANALGGDDADNPAQYMLDMYKLASLTEDSETGNNLFSQN